MPLMTRSSNPICPRAGAARRRLLDGNAALWAALCLSASIYRSITRMCGSGRSSITTAKGWRCFAVTTTLVDSKERRRMDGCVCRTVDSARSSVIYNVCNHVRPQAGQSALLSWDEVITLFHEFGHTLHGLFASQRYASLSRTNTRAILSNFLRRSSNTGPASRRWLPTRSTTSPGEPMPGRYATASMLRCGNLQ